MIDIKTKFMGLELKNPIIIGSCGLTNSVDKIKKLEENGASAVVLKSLFQEQLMANKEKLLNQNDDYYHYPEAMDYIAEYSSDQGVMEHVNLIKSSKKEVGIPIIASINCISDGEWVSYAKEMENAGADAIELNVAILPSDPSRTSKQNEQIHFDIIKSVRKQVSIPLGLKMSYFSAGLAQFIQQLSWTKNIDGLVLFNRFYSPDIDIEKFRITSTNVFSKPHEISTSLRWIAIMSDKVSCDLASTTGIHNAEGVIKQLLAGASAVQIVSAIYKHGPEYILEILKNLKEWMMKKDFDNIEAFKGKMSYENVSNSSAFERIQFMKYFKF